MTPGIAGIEELSPSRAIFYCAAKSAVTTWSASIVTAQAVPVQSPVHVTNLEPAAGVAVSTTAVPCAKVVLQVVVQFTPVGVEVTVPAPPTATFRDLSCCAVNPPVDEPLVLANGDVPVASPPPPQLLSRPHNNSVDEIKRINSILSVSDTR